MPESAYKGSKGSRIKNNAAIVIATAAFVVAVTGVPGVTAGGLLVGSKQIKNDSITSKDLKNSGVRSTDIATGGVTSSDIGEGDVQSGDIGNGQVQPEDVTAPPPAQIQETGPTETVVGTDFTPMGTVGTYTKTDPTSVLQVEWTGTAAAPEVSCVYQLRVDGEPSPGNGGLVFVATQTLSTQSVSASALFPGLVAGPHRVEVWAKITSASGTSKCVIGPAEAGIPQSFIVTENVT